MMGRDYLFRVYDPETKAMELVGAIDWQYDFKKIITCNTKERKHYFGYHEDLDPIIMQYTGLLDRNGNKIFEGDVLKDKEGQVRVTFRNGSFITEFQTMSKQWNTYGTLSLYLEQHEGEIIGNIHEGLEVDSSEQIHR